VKSNNIEERKKFEEWLLDHQQLTATWDEKRNSYTRFQAHLAWKAWQQSAHNTAQLERGREIAREILRTSVYSGNKVTYFNEGKTLSSDLARFAEGVL
jgi:heme-degrading monooxygenase HmoA